MVPLRPGVAGVGAGAAGVALALPGVMRWVPLRLGAVPGAGFRVGLGAGRVRSSRSLGSSRARISRTAA